MKVLNAETFLIEHLIHEKKYKDISAEYNVPTTQLTEWWDEEPHLRKVIAKSNTLYNERKKGAEAGKFINNFLSKKDFYDWYKSQARICAYCGITEEKLEAIFDYEYGSLSTKRGRGRTLELDRVDSSEKANDYSSTNCALSCYLCNNHKSDLITKDEFKKYFSASFLKFQEDKYIEALSKKEMK